MFTTHEQSEESEKQQGQRIDLRAEDNQTIV